MSLTTKAIAIFLLCGALIAGWWRLTAYYDNRGYQRRAQEDSAAAEEQTARNRELQRTVELRYTVAAQVRESFTETTAKEVRHETAELAACIVPPAAVSRLRNAAACARGDSAAACGPDQPVRRPE